VGVIERVGVSLGVALAVAVALTVTVAVPVAAANVFGRRVGGGGKGAGDSLQAASRAAAMSRKTRMDLRLLRADIANRIDSTLRLPEGGRAVYWVGNA
jgi:hypothetical protein